MRREKTSRTNAAQTLPANVRTYVMPATRNRFGASALDRRLNRSEGLPVSDAGLVVRGHLARDILRRPFWRISRSTVHRTTGTSCRCSSLWDLAGSVDAVARRNSRTTRSSPVIRSESAVIAGRKPSAILARLTQVRSASGFTPSCSPIRRNAPVLVAGSFVASMVIRVARSSRSFGYLRCAGILPGN